MTAAIKTVDPSDTLGVLRAAREWLSDPEHWTTRAFWRDRDGYQTSCRGDVTATCAGGAVMLVMGTCGCLGALPVIRLLDGALEGDETSTSVNDGPDGYARILAGLDKAIAALESEGA